MPNIDEIRPATVYDTLELASLHLAAWRVAYKGIVPDKTLAELSTFGFEESWRKALTTPGQINFVCKKFGQITGVISIGPIRDADGDPSRTAEIYGIYLLPEFWGKGQAWALWLAVKEWLMKSSFVAIRLWVLEANIRARKFCERVGFVRDLAARKYTTHGGVAWPENGYSFALR